MKLSINGIKEQEAWKKAGIALPGYDVEAASEKAKENPVWVHFGIGTKTDPRFFIAAGFRRNGACYCHRRMDCR